MPKTISVIISTAYKIFYKTKKLESVRLRDSRCPNTDTMKYMIVLLDPRQDEIIETVEIME